MIFHNISNNLCTVIQYISILPPSGISDVHLKGDGIGKNSDGIAAPIKASLKFDNAGLGHDRGKEFTNHWWQNAFNSAANNIDVNTDGGAVSMSLKNGESVEVIFDIFGSIEASIFQLLFVVEHR